MIKVVKEKEPKKLKKPKKPYYLLVYNYMIGDANGNTSEEIELSADNPFIERYVSLLNKLQPIKGSWGIQLKHKDIFGNFKEKRITEDDFNFLNRIMLLSYDEEENTYFKTEIENDFAYELSEGIRTESEYSFLVFQGVDLYYFDENGKKNKTKILKGKVKK